MPHLGLIQRQGFKGWRRECFPLSGNTYYGIPQNVCQSVPWLKYKTEHSLF